MSTGRVHFACTRCGACCNRAPEIELGEAGQLAETFVLRLMFRVYSLPVHFATYLASRPGQRAPSSAEFYQIKQKLKAFSVSSWTSRRREDHSAVEYSEFLVISALAFDPGLGACPQLNDQGCGIHARRPLSCRTVPFHYSRPEATALRELVEFVSRPGYACDSSANAAVVLVDGKITDPQILADRAAALNCAAVDRRWKNEIVRRMKAGNLTGLPTMADVKSAAGRGALTTSMRIAWQIACEAGLLNRQDYRNLIVRQLDAIDRQLETGLPADEAAETLIEMRREHAAALAAPPIQ